MWFSSSFFWFCQGGPRLKSDPRSHLSPLSPSYSSSCCWVRRGNALTGQGSHSTPSRYDWFRLCAVNREIWPSAQIVLRCWSRPVPKPHWSKAGYSPAKTIRPALLIPVSAFPDQPCCRSNRSEHRACIETEPHWASVGRYWRIRVSL